MTIPFVAGRSVYLRGLTRDDLRSMLPWTDDREVTRYLSRGAYPATIEQLERDYERIMQSAGDTEVGVVETAADRLIGVTGIYSINWIARSGEFRILLGERSCWGRGYGTEATQLAVAYAFEVLNLHKVWLGVNTANAPAIRTYEKTGFVREGELRDEVYRNSRYYNATRMSILRDEYRRVKSSWAIGTEIESQFRA